MSEHAYKQALTRDMIACLKLHVYEWRLHGANDGDERMYDLEAWVHEIWGEEE